MCAIGSHSILSQVDHLLTTEEKQTDRVHVLRDALHADVNKCGLLTMDDNRPPPSDSIFLGHIRIEREREREKKK